MKFIVKSRQEIMDQIGRATDSMDKGTSLPGMCYEEGVIAALYWVIGDSDDPPMDDE